MGRRVMERRAGRRAPGQQHRSSAQLGERAMVTNDGDGDIQAIKAVIARQFGSLNWTAETSADWDAFRADFLPDASLYPAARPAIRQSVAAFVERMSALAQTKLRSFREAVLGSDIRVFGNVAVAVAACQITENDSKTSRGVEMLLLIKDEGTWRIVSQAWDTETDTRRIPADLLDAPSA